MNYNRQEKINRIIAEMKSPDYNKDVDASVKKRENTAIKICVSVLLLFLIITIAVSAVLSHYLNKVNSPEDIKKLEISELKVLADEVR